MDLDRSLRRSDASVSSTLPSFSAPAAGSTPPLSEIPQLPAAAAQGATPEASSSQPSANPNAQSASAADSPDVQQRHADSGTVSAAPETSNQAAEESATLMSQVSTHTTHGRQEPVQATIAVIHPIANSDDVQLPSESVSDSQASKSAVPAQGQSNCHAPDPIFIIDSHATEIVWSCMISIVHLLASEVCEPARCIQMQ